jgi:hypothetical protein
MKLAGELILDCMVGKKQVRRSWTHVSPDDLGPLIEFLMAHDYREITAVGVRDETEDEAAAARIAAEANRASVNAQMSQIAHECETRAKALESEVVDLRDRATRARRLAETS